MVRIKPLIILLIFLPGLALAQTNRYMVFLTDKDGSAYSVNAPGEFLSAKSIERRNNQGIAVIEEDLPVNDTYIQGIKDLGVDVYFTSKWLNAALIQTDESNITDIESLSYVSRVEYIAPNSKLTFNSRKFEEDDYQDVQTQNGQQLSLLGIETLHGDNLYGSGISMAFFDGGFLGVDNTDAFKHIFDEDRLTFQYNMVENNTEVFHSSSHGTKVFSTVAAEITDIFEGVASKADFMLFITEDVSGEFRIEEYNWLIAAEKADSAGVDIINSSLGYNIFDDPSMDYTYEDLDGNTAVITQAASIASTKGILVVTSVGNEGNNSWGFLTVPSDADNILAVGSVTSEGVISNFSSSGPSADGRIKPDVVAMGGSAKIVGSTGTITSGSGTSYAAPQVAGLAALLWESNPELTNLELRDLIIELSNRSENPDNQYGYGIPSFNSTLGFGDDFGNVAMAVFPNPVSENWLNIELEGLAGRINFSIIDTKGQRLYTKSIDNFNSKSTLDISNLAPGIYLLETIYQNHLYKARFVKL